MYLSTSNAVGEFTSPFGSRVTIVRGMVTELPVDEAYWLYGHPEIEVTFADDAERDRCYELQDLAKLNPLKGVPKPQQLTPNATLQLDGYSTRIPVIVVNPVGLMAEYQGEYNFQQPQVNLVFDKAMVRQVMEEFQAALYAGPEELPEVPGIEALSESELEKLTNPEPPQEEAVPEFASPETTGELASPDDAPDVGAPSEEPTESLADTDPTSSKGKGKGRRGAISDEDI